jgi:hypothetical protein
VARNRQRAKERQAERRAARQTPGEDTGAVPGAQLNAPPQELGQPDYTLAHTSEEEEFIGDLQVHEPGEPDEYAEDDGSAAESRAFSMRSGSSCSGSNGPTVRR